MAPPDFYPGGDEPEGEPVECDGIAWDRIPIPPRMARADSPAMRDALAAMAALGRATRIAQDATADWYDPERALLIRRWLTYAWSTRSAKHHVEHTRALLRNAVDCYRALHGRDGRKAGTHLRRAA